MPNVDHALHHPDHHGAHEMPPIPQATTTLGSVNTEMPVVAADHFIVDHSQHHHGAGGGNHDSEADGHSMKMYFHDDYRETVLFKCWKVESVPGLVVACLAMFVLAFVYELLKVAREHLLHRALQCACVRCSALRSPASSPCSAENGNLHNGSYETNVASYETTVMIKPTPQANCGGNCDNYPNDCLRLRPIRPWSAVHVAQTGLHTVQFVVAYLLMLVFMTYNVWLCAAVTVGSGLGYWACAWTVTKRLSYGQFSKEHCH